MLETIFAPLGPIMRFGGSYEWDPRFGEAPESIEDFIEETKRMEFAS